MNNIANLSGTNIPRYCAKYKGFWNLLKYAQ